MAATLTRPRSTPRLGAEASFFMEIVSVGPVSGGPEALERELSAVSKRIGESKLGILYLPEQVDHAAYLAAARSGLAAPIVGATTGGVAFTERGASRTDPVAAVLSGDQADFHVSVASDLGKHPEQRIAAAIRPLVDAAKKRATRSVSVMTLADAFACDGETLVRALTCSTPAHWRHFGGTAGDDWAFRRSLVFAHGEVLRDAAVLVGMFTDTAPSVMALHGLSVAPGSREFVVTDIDGAVLRTLDDRPAAEVYEEELRRLGLLASGDDLLEVMATFELGARTAYGDQLKIRAPLGLEPGGGVRLASSLPPGTVVSLVSADAEQLVAAARELSARTLEPRGQTPLRGALVFDCAARLQLLGDRYDEEVQAFLGRRNFPMVGMSCYGEIAKYGGSVEGFHNTTAVMAAW